uniref:Uncharacterized protein n=1 Tax=Pararge aegeria TaxID=116150 RepID=S4P667_9NEOP
MSPLKWNHSYLSSHATYYNIDKSYRFAHDSNLKSKKVLNWFGIGTFNLHTQSFFLSDKVHMATDQVAQNQHKWNSRLAYYHT